MIFAVLLAVLFAVIVLVLYIKYYVASTKRYCDSSACLIGKTALITGGNSGMGYQCALNLASRGCRVIIADVVDGEKSVETIKEQTGNQNIVYKHIDLASFASVRKFAASLRSNEERLDILINNAGCAGFQTKSHDGIYKVIQINHLSHFLLTHLLTPLLTATKNSRVVFVSSIFAYIHYFKRGDTINRLSSISLSPFGQFFDYNNSKLVMLAASDMFAERLKKHGVLVTAVHPGIVKTAIWTTSQTNTALTDIGTRLGFWCLRLPVRLFGKTPVEGIQSILHGALSSRVQSGDFVVDCSNFRKPFILDDSLRKAVWDESLKLASVAKEEEIC